MRVNCQGTRLNGENGAGAPTTGRHCEAFTMAEVVIAILILGISLGGILGVYLNAAIRSDWIVEVLLMEMERA